MKNFIFLNYNIVVEKIYSNNNKKYFFINDTKYYIYEYNNIDTNKNISDNYLDTLFEITNQLYYKNIKVYTFILNNENKYYTKKNDKYIVILKVNSLENEVDLENLIVFQNINSKLPEYNVLEVWENEVDLIEKQLIEYNTEYPLIQNSVNYFIGLAENAIALMSNYKKEILTNNDSIGHKFDYKMYKSCKLGDPFTFIKVNKMYDLANFVKYNFYIKNIDYEEVNYIINVLGNSEYDKVYFFANMMYPNVYFDLIKKILNGDEEEEKLNLFLNNIKNYKNMLINCQNLIKNVKIIKLISWLGE